MPFFQVDNISKKGIRLDHFLVSRTTSLSRTKIQSLIRSGNVLVNGHKCKTGYLLELNDMVHMNIPEIDNCEDQLVPENQNLDIIFEDEYLIAVNKPAGLVVHPGIGISSNTLANGLKYHFNKLSDIGGMLRPGIVHRLDKNTSGVLLVAKTNEVHTFLASQFRERSIEKKYFALTWGIWSEKKGIIQEPLSRNRKDPRNYQVDSSGKESITGFRVEEVFRHITSVAFYPKTGRTHQIRVHASFKGHPIVGDSKYGGKHSKTRGYLPEFEKYYNNELDKFSRHALHASKIKFKHPFSKKFIILEAPLPKEYLNLQNNISSFNFERFE